MLSDRSSRRSSVADDQNRYHSRDVRPAEILSDMEADAGFHVEPSERLLQVAKAGLDLDDEQNPRAGVSRDDVDPARSPYRLKLTSTCTGHPRDRSSSAVAC